MNKKDKEFIIVSKYCKTYHNLNDDEKDCIYNFIKDSDYSLRNAYKRFNIISVNSDRDISICKDWITKYSTIADIGRAYNMCTGNCDRIIREFVKNVVRISYSKLYKKSDSLLCFNLNNYDINYLARNGIITIDDLINNTIGDSVDNLRFIYTGKSVPDGLKKRIKFNDDLYLLLKERKFKNAI